MKKKTSDKMVDNECLTEDEKFFKHLSEEMINHPEKFAHLMEENEPITDPNKKYIEEGYEALPGDVFIYEDKKMPFEEFFLYAERNLLLLECQPTYTKIYQNLRSGEFFKIEAEFIEEISFHEEDIEGGVDMNDFEMIDFFTSKITLIDMELEYGGYILAKDCLQARRKFIIKSLCNE